MQLSVQFSKPYYGKRTDSYLNFLAPGVLSSSAYALPVALTALALVLERKEGLLERMWVAGVTAGQQVFGHFFTQVFVLVVQVLLVVFFTLVVFDVGRSYEHVDTAVINSYVLDSMRRKRSSFTVTSVPSRNWRNESWTGHFVSV
eukprot:m.296095 g.296095  ORF g.296095 m.296095 type:complete len:145 (+) comp40762_c0_seq35:2305-2739(+)